MALFECGRVRGRGLQVVCKYLHSITPVSVEAEWTLAAAGVNSCLTKKSLSA